MQNLHTHTKYVDGSLSAEEMITAALEKGCGSLGFSEHAYIPFDAQYSMTPEATYDYVKEINALKDKYSDRIEIFLGLERDFFSPIETDIKYDYIIGSVHYSNPSACVDNGAEKVKQTAERCYNGDFYAFAEDYFAAVSDIPGKTGADIIGHFDLLTKYNFDSDMFDETHPRYVAAALDAMEKIQKSCNLFEVNTGAMYRLGKREPYPSVFLLKELQKRGGEVIISSDSHDGESICYRYNEMRELLTSCGFKYMKVLTKNGFADVRI